MVGQKVDGVGIAWRLRCAMEAAEAEAAIIEK
jgi:hypothetical protein